MDWPTATVIMGTAATVVGGIVGIWKHNKKEGSSESTPAPAPIHGESMEVRLARLEEQHGAIASRLDDLKKEVTERTGEVGVKVETLSRQFTDLLIELKSQHKG